MRPGTVALVLAAATAHAVWNIASKYKRGNTFLFVWAYTCASALLCVPRQPENWTISWGQRQKSPPIANTR
ncbi:transporter [Pandoraea horticolens]|uniref:Transporter n=1 Tax=Pandoraea horticolens TaxID=2508298 RepID=A0A5E4WMU2_9BURK|nr:transporter [Pandoraea horticolens]